MLKMRISRHRRYTMSGKIKKSGLVLTYEGRPNQIFKVTGKGLASPYKQNTLLIDFESKGEVCSFKIDRLAAVCILKFRRALRAYFLSYTLQILGINLTF